jgi:hypothetical protein
LTIGWIPAIEKPFSQVRDGTRQNPVEVHDGYRRSHMRCTVVVATTTATTATQRAVKCPHSRAAAPTAGVHRSGHRGTPREKRYPIGKYPIAASVDGWWSVGRARSGRALSRA